MIINFVHKDSSLELFYVEESVKIVASYSKDNLVKVALISKLTPEELLHFYGICKAVSDGEERVSSFTALSSKKTKLLFSIGREELDGTEDVFYEYKIYVEEVASGRFVVLLLNPAKFKALIKALSRILEVYLV